MNKPNTVKEVGYAYPSSEIAARLGKGQTGCWLVRTFDSSKLIAPIDLNGCAYDTKEEAFAAADAMPIPFGKYSMAR